MSLNAFERETIININDEDKQASIYTCQQKYKNKLTKLAKKFPDIYKLIREDEYSQTYEIPKKLITFRTPREKKEITEEQRQELRERGLRLSQSRK